MARFIGYIEGGRGAASRTGHKTTGLTVRGQGWETGALVVLQYDEATDSDVVVVYRTAGSNGGGYDVEVARWTSRDEVTK